MNVAVDVNLQNHLTMFSSWIDDVRNAGYALGFHQSLVKRLTLTATPTAEHAHPALLINALKARGVEAYVTERMIGGSTTTCYLMEDKWSRTEVLLYVGAVQPQEGY